MKLTPGCHLRGEHQDQAAIDVVFHEIRHSAQLREKLQLLDLENIKRSPILLRLLENDSFASFIRSKNPREVDAMMVARICTELYTHGVTLDHPEYHTLVQSSAEQIIEELDRIILLAHVS